jgi:hypothetical protein
VPELAFWKSEIASSWKALWKVDPLPWMVPDTLAPALVAAPADVELPAPAAAVVFELLLLLLLLPQAAATIARASTPASAPPRRFVMFTLVVSFALNRGRR